jgi:hypothetical protein
MLLINRKTLRFQSNEYEDKYSQHFLPHQLSVHRADTLIAAIGMTAYVIG